MRQKRNHATRDKPTPRRCEDSGKVKFQSHTQALIAAGKVIQPGGELGAYKCDDCGMWHMTSNVYRPEYDNRNR
jgi:hypothetical protein